MPGPEREKSPDWDEYRRFLAAGKIDVGPALDNPRTDPPYLCPKCMKDVRRRDSGCPETWRVRPCQTQQQPQTRRAARKDTCEPLSARSDP